MAGCRPCRGCCRSRTWARPAVDEQVETRLAGPVDQGALVKVDCCAPKPVRKNARRVFALRRATAGFHLNTSQKVAIHQLDRKMIGEAAASERCFI
jgi:hypothetical protein